MAGRSGRTQEGKVQCVSVHNSRGSVDSVLMFSPQEAGQEAVVGAFQGWKVRLAGGLV